MAANKVPEPREWVDLVKPEYFGHVAISSPSRSGTTHLTVETILQGEGWKEGWAQIIAISGNSAAITERSFACRKGWPPGNTASVWSSTPRASRPRPRGCRWSSSIRR